jgi:hypothetical protein
MSGLRVNQELARHFEGGDDSPLICNDNDNVMFVKNLRKSLSNLKNISVRVSAVEEYPTPGAASVRLFFADGSQLRAEYWRITKGGKAGRSSFDHHQQYGLPAPIDAIAELQEQLQNRTLTDAQLDSETGDLLFQFADDIKFRVFNFTGYEVWEIHFPDGGGEYSPGAR